MKIKEIVYYTPIVPGDNPNTKMLGECCDYECFEKGDSICFHYLRKPMTITIDWSNVRDPKDWDPSALAIPLADLIPTAWPKGQSVWDRIHWLDLAVGQSIDSKGGYSWLFSNLQDSALGLLCGKKK